MIYIDELKRLLTSGIIDAAHIQSEIEDIMRKKDLLSQYKYKIWQGQNGYWYTYVFDNGKKKLVKRTTQDAIEEYVVARVEYEKTAITVDVVFKDWSERRRDLKQIAKSTYDRDVKTYNKHFESFGKKDIKTLTVGDIANFLEEEVARHELSAKGFGRLKGVMYGIIKHARRCGYTKLTQYEIAAELDVTDRSLKKVIKEDSQEVFDEDETAKVIEYLEEHQDIRNLGILLIFVTGLRVGELVSIKISDITDDSEIRIRRTETRYRDDESGHVVYTVKDYPKTKAGVRTVIVPDAYKWVVRKMRLMNPFGEYLLTENGNRINTDLIRKRMKRITAELNLVHKSPHKIRKTYGTILLDNDLDQRLVTELMGHSSIICTENFYHRNRKSAKRKHDLVSNIPDFQTVAN